MRKAVVFFAAFFTFGVGFAADPIIDLNAVDSSVNPCEDFYHYACGKWLKEFKLPADRSSYNHQTSALGEATLAKLRTLLTEYSRGQVRVPARYAQKLGAFYASCMDTSAIERQSPVAVNQAFHRIEALKTPEDIARLTAEIQLKGGGAFFSLTSQADLRDSKMNIADLSQGGLSFDDRGYYFEKDPKSVETREKFLAHVRKMFALAGFSKNEANAAAATVLAFETKLAERSLPVQDMQDSTLLYHPTDFPGVRAQIPSFDWTTYLRTLGLAEPSTVNVATPEFFRALTDILRTEKTANLKVYLKWHVLRSMAPTLAKAFRDENFDFWNRYLAGAKKQSPRWKQCTVMVQREMSEALGEAYVNSFGDAAAIRSQVATMINQIKAALEEDFGTLTWFDAKTRSVASQKLSKVTDKVGFPERWRNFDELTVVGSTFGKNVENSSIFDKRFDLAKIGKPVDRSLWDMPPWEQNAYYDPSANQMVFPLGALIPPIFDLGSSRGANFGSLGGGWIGHELTHGFDSDGRHFDGEGNLNEWWSERTKADYEKRAQCLVEQANAYEVLPGLTVNGKQTLGENIADQGGTKLGYLALLTATGGRPSAPSVGPFNERQQYWVAYAQSWCTKETDARVRLLVKTDVHPPAEFRANAVLFNRPEFATDFNCRPGQRMVPQVRCSVW